MRVIFLLSIFFIFFLFSCDLFNPAASPPITPPATVTIGTQVWTTKNLKADHYRNGDSIPEVRDSAAWANLTTGAWCYYNNDPEMGAIYGKLYNWYAIKDIRGLAPVGWHISTNEEWNTLILYLGGENIAGGKLKESGTLHWATPNTGATNESGFTALPGGWRHSDCTFNYFSNFGLWWTTTEYNADYAWVKVLDYDLTMVSSGFDIKGIGHYIRCVKN